MSVIASGALLTLSGMALAAEGPTGIFSSYRTGKSGDIVGEEVIITRAVSHYFATIQCSEGAPGDPYLVRLDAKGTAIKFSLPEDNVSGCRPGGYEGTVTAKGLTLKHGTSGWSAFLARSKSFWE